MIYQIIIMKEKKLSSFLNKLKDKISTLEFCPPSEFIDIEKTYNLPKVNNNFIFKIKNTSPLTYFVCRVKNKDKVTLNTIINEYDGALENLNIDKKSSISIFKENLILLFVFLMNLDVILAFVYYIFNFKAFFNTEKVNKLNIFCILASIIGLSNFSILGYKIPNLNINPILYFTPNIGNFSNISIIFIGTILIILFSKHLTNVALLKNEENNKFKNINEFKF
jgi:hypothetical protein